MNNITDLEKVFLIQAELLSDSDKTEEEIINENNIGLSLVANPVLVELFNKYGFSRRGHSAWSRSVSNNFAHEETDLSYIRAFLADVVRIFGAGVISLREYGNTNYIEQDSRGSLSFYKEEQPRDGRLGYARLYENYADGRIASLSTGVMTQNYRYSFGTVLRGIDSHVEEWSNMLNGFSKYERAFYSDRWQNLGLIQISHVVRGQFWVRLISYENLVESAQNIRIANAHKLTGHKNKTVVPLSSHAALQAIQNLQDVYCYGNTEVDFLDYKNSDPEALALLRKAENTVAVGYLPNNPTSVVLKVGRNVTLPEGMKKYRKLVQPVSLRTAMSLQAQNEDVNFLIHPALGDVISMSKAKPFTADSRLMDYQQEAVGLHLATNIGYVQSCSPGLGKTVIQLSAMRERAKRKGGAYRALVICEANVREQWRDDFFEDWFPEANVVVINSASQKQIGTLLQKLSLNEPVVVITSYALAGGVIKHLEAQKERADVIATAVAKGEPVPVAEPDVTLGSVLLSVFWDDLCADEAKQIRNNSSQQAEAAWVLRKNAEVATALIGTPINKGIKDVANLISWVRGDSTLFSGDVLKNQIEEAENSGAMETVANKVFSTLSPLLFRRDSSVLSEGLLADVVNIKHDLYPNPAEKALAFAAEQELKRCYQELVEALNNVSPDTVSTEEKNRIRERVKQAHGAWLGGIHLARMSMSDPESLMQSKSVSASLLKSQGLVNNALASTPTKRTKLIEIASKAVADGKQMIVFTDFSSVANILATTLEENGISAGVFSGENQRTRATVLRKYKNQELDVIVMTSAGERGLNLQTTDILCHYDVPWTPENLIQRTARAVRIGSGGKDVEVIFMVMKGTVEERVARNVMKNGITSSMVLDNSRGVNLEKTETAISIMGLLDLLTDEEGENSNLINNYAELINS